MIEHTRETALTMDNARHTTRRFGRWGVPVTMAALCATVVVGMGADAGAGAGAGAATAPTGAGANGSVASISGTTMEVQSATEGQTSVSWTPTTTFSETADRDGERSGGRGLPDGDRYPVEEVQDHGGRPVHHDQPAHVDGDVRRGIRRRGRRWVRRRGPGRVRRRRPARLWGRYAAERELSEQGAGAVRVREHPDLPAGASRSPMAR